MTIPRLLAATLAALCATSASAALPDDVALRALLGKPALQAPGCAMAVYRDGRLQTLVANGSADLETGTPLDGDTLFYAASVSKQFTALAVVQLHLAGKLDLDGDIRRWIPELPRHAATVTPRMMLQHRSGILDSLSLVSLTHGPGAGGTTGRKDTLDLVLKQTATNFVPGTETYYSNGAYLLLSELIQRTSGKSYPDYIRQHVLEPMGMRDSYMLDGDPRPSARNAHGYAPANGDWEVRDTFPRFGGSGGLMLSLNDLARYEYDIEKGHKVWTKPVQALMTAPGTLTDGKPAYTQDRPGGMVYASGLMTGERNGRTIVEHGGGAEAFRHMYSRVPAARLAVATFCNLSQSGAVEKTNAAIDLLLPAAAGAQTGGPATGIYRVQTLPVRYVLARSSADTIELAAIPDGQSEPSFHATLKREGSGGTFSGDGMNVETAPGGDALIVGTARARGLRAVREQP